MIEIWEFVISMVVGGGLVAFGYFLGRRSSQ
jgi:hypothetical protein